MAISSRLLPNRQLSPNGLIVAWSQPRDASWDAGGENEWSSSARTIFVEINAIPIDMG